MDTANISIAIPAEATPGLLRAIADVLEQDRPAAPPRNVGHRQRARRGWGRAAVEDAYLGGKSQAWAPFLDHLAEHADQWVAQDAIADAIDYPRRGMPGMVGAGERRCGKNPPYEKRTQDGVREYRMPTTVAQHILGARQLAAPSARPETGRDFLKESSPDRT